MEDKNKNKSHISYHKEQNLHRPKKSIAQCLLLYTVHSKWPQDSYYVTLGCHNCTRLDME